jgi:hypothetical protein
MADARVHSAAAPAPWLEIIEADSPLLLIAPHGGAAGARARARLHPKVNDLHTAAITRELAARTGAFALINSGMDRNQLDCNRIPQLAEHAPWMLEIVAEHLARIVDRHGRATVLLVHGWNIIEPRVDFGLGLRRHGDELRPPGSAHVSARDEFIHGPLSELAARLREGGIQPTWGMRYPAGGVHNLVQAFTGRHRESAIAPLRAIAAISALGAVDAAQLELSVAVRMPGELRARCLDALVSVFRGGSDRARPVTRAATRVVRTAAPRPAAPVRTASVPTRVGIEFFDPAAKVGAMASFDLGAGGTGARIMMLLGRRRVALFTAEGRPQISGTRLALGPLALEIAGGALSFQFRGPAVIVPDGAAYLSIERALASGRLDPNVCLDARMPIDSTAFDLASIAAGASQPAPSQAPIAAFATLSGEVRADGFAGTIEAAARAGMSFTGLGPQRFRARRMIWASFSDGPMSALELRSITEDAGAPHLTARVLAHGGWRSAELALLSIDAPSPEEPPPRIEASFADGAGVPLTIGGSVAAFIPLSRPGPDQSRIYTSLGFARFECGGRVGSGMFEYSRRHDAPSESIDAAGDSEPDQD